MSRRLVANVFLSLLILAAGILSWALVYEVITALRFKPTMAGEGQHRWDLMLAQSADQSWHTFQIPFRHFYERVIYVPTRLETLTRGSIALAVTFMGGLGLCLAARLNRPPSHYGAAKFGNIIDAEKARLTGPKGLVVGKLGTVVLRSDDPAHVLVVGPTRSGKGVSFVVPNGLSWQGSSIWFDPKGENYAAFGRKRMELGDKVFVFSPGNKVTHRYNPLEFVRRDERMPTDCLVVASFLITDDGKEIWGRSARILMQAMIGYVVACCPQGKRNLNSVADLTRSGEDFNLTLKAVVKDVASLPKWVADGFKQFIALEKETRNSALFNVTTALAPWNSELIIAATETCDFDIRTLRREPMAIFVSASVAELDVFRPLVKLLIQQVHDQLMQNLPGKDEPLQVLIMIDEFRQLGRMDDLVSKLTINAGYGFRMCLILQDVGQLDELYGRPTRITTMSACQIKLFIRINDVETSEYVSEMLGNRTEQLTTPLIRGNQKMFSRRDKNVQYIETPLRSPQSLREMSDTLSILLVPNSPGFEVKKIRYFADHPWKRIATSIKGKALPQPRLLLANSQKSKKDSVVAKSDKIAPATVSETPAEQIIHVEVARRIRDVQLPDENQTRTANVKEISSVAPVIARLEPAKPEPFILKKSPVKGFKKNTQVLNADDSVSLNSLIRAAKEVGLRELSDLKKYQYKASDTAVFRQVVEEIEEELVVFEAAERDG